jgi:heme-degrading monooxygenase HmoA
MFIAMNRFRINHGFEDAFEQMWQLRDSRLGEVPGFRRFRLLKGPDDGSTCLYASHTLWESRAHFDAWRDSENFKRAHAQAKAPQGTYAGHPEFEGFEVVLDEHYDAL